MFKYIMKVIYLYEYLFFRIQSLQNKYKIYKVTVT